MAKTNGWIETIDVSQYTSYTPTMRINPELDFSFLSSAANAAYKSFYMRPGKIFKEVLSDSFLKNLSLISLEKYLQPK